MRLRPRRLSGLLLLGMWVVGAGCGDAATGPGEATPGEVVVSGTVTQNGRPITSGEVLFEPTGGPAADGKPLTTPIGIDGNYDTTLIPGQYRVTVKKGEANPRPVGKPKELNVEGGGTTFDIRL